MGNIKRSFIVFLSVILIGEFAHSATVDKKAEKRVDQDSYIDALHKTHAEDSLNCECLNILSGKGFCWMYGFF